MRTLVRRSTIVGAATVALLAVSTIPAWAHVTVDAPGATQGGSDQIINVRVPTESDTASTVGLKFQLPINTPIASVLVQPTPGWTFTETSVNLAKPIVTDDGDITSAVSEIDWTAQPGQGIKPEEFQQFTMIAGQLPDTSSLTFKAIQTYSDGSVVSWIETPAAGSNAEPDHPAPVLTLSPSFAAAGAPSVASLPPKSSSDTGAIVLAIVALVVVAAASLGFGVVSRAQASAARAAAAGASAARSSAGADQ